MSADFSMNMENSPSLVESTQAGPDTSSTTGEDSSSSSLWIWAFVFVVIGFFMLVVYYYILYFYDATSLSDAIENAIKKFNKSDDDDDSRGNTGSTGDYYSDEEDDEDEDEITFKKVLIKALDDSTTEGFSTYSADTSFGTIQKKGTLDWGFIEDSSPNCSIEESGKCMSGDIFPTRDICINPKLRSQ